MPSAGFYNQNEYRAYPFIYDRYRPEPSSSSLPSPTSLDSRLIVDFNARFGPETGFSDLVDAATRAAVRVWLAEIRRNGTTVEFEFRTNVYPAANYALIFTREIDDKAWKIEFTDAVRIALDESSNSGTCADDYIWEGFLVTGDMSNLVLGDGESLTFSSYEWQVEPALLEAADFVTSISLANVDRTRALAPCDAEQVLVPRPVYINRQCLTGPLLLKEGYNCAIRQDDNTNTITISAAVGAGEGEPCEEVPLYEDEAPPDLHASSGLLSGGPSCGDIISRINGIPGPNVRIEGDRGIRIIPDGEDPHGLVIVVDTDPLTACVGASESSDGGE